MHLRYSITIKIILCTKHTNYHLRGKTDQYISVNNILEIKFCLAVELT